MDLNSSSPLRCNPEPWCLHRTFQGNKGFLIKLRYGFITLWSWSQPGWTRILTDDFMAWPKLRPWFRALKLITKIHFLIFAPICFLTFYVSWPFLATIGSCLPAPICYQILHPSPPFLYKPNPDTPEGLFHIVGGPSRACNKVYLLLLHCLVCLLIGIWIGLNTLYP